MLFFRFSKQPIFVLLMTVNGASLEIQYPRKVRTTFIQVSSIQEKTEPYQLSNARLKSEFPTLLKTVKDRNCQLRNPIRIRV